MKEIFYIGDKKIQLRPATELDWKIQFLIYANTRQEEMELVDWSEEQKNAFLQQQFQAQTAHYQQYYPKAKTSIILFDNDEIGRVILSITDRYIHIIDIALIFEHRNLGIGSILITDLMNDAISLNLPIVLRVEIFNPAIRLYQRFGFHKTKCLEVYQEMMWSPPQLQT